MTDITDVEPRRVEGSVLVCAYAAIIIAAAMSITLNVHHDIQHPDVAGIALPEGIAIMVGVCVPLLCALISHVAATIPLSNWARGWLFFLTGVLMYVSATAGTATLSPVMRIGPALAVAIGTDATAMTFLGVLMLAQARKAGWQAWQGREGERARRAEADALAARYARPAARETAPGNTGGNTATPARGNASAAPGGNAPPARALPAAPPVAGRETPAGHGGEGRGTVTQLRPAAAGQGRPPVATEDDIRRLAADLAGRLAKAGRELTVRAYIDEYGGKTDRVAPIIAQVKAERAAALAAASGDR